MMQDEERTVELRPSGHDDKVVVAGVTAWLESGLLCVDVTPLPGWWREIDRHAPPNATRCMLILTKRPDGVYEDVATGLEFKVE